MKKILYVILPLALVLALAIGTAFSAWQFESVGESQIDLTNKRDDIFENYDIKKANDTQVNRVKTYEMYLYPSTLYLNDYLDYLDGGSTTLPEDRYGYIEPSVDKNGNVTYNVVNKNNGDNGYLQNVAGNTDYTMEDGTIAAYMYYGVYEKNTEWTGNGSAGLSGNVTIGTQSISANSRLLYGDPKSDATALTYSYGDEQHGWRNLHYYDRFGYWPTLSKDYGRYLPLKITVDENFSNTFYDNVVLSPFADMGDPHNWYVYTFSCWAYVAYDATAKTYTAPYYATDEFAAANSGTRYVGKDSDGKIVANPSLGSFCPTMVSQYFDIIESFEKYADENGVIRLFPKFSNGKGYQAYSGLGTIKDGGGDAIKVIPKLKGKDKDGNDAAKEMSPLDQHELYMFYSTESGTVSDGSTTATVHVSVLPNIDIDNYFSLNFKAAIVPNMAGWGEWYDIYSLDRKESASDDTNKNIPETLKSYGYGLYNLYLFITDVGGSASKVDLTDKLDQLRQKLVNKNTDVRKSFPTLFGKNLLPLAEAYVQGKSFMLVAEKVREAKFIGDVNFGSSNYTTEEQIEAKYLSTDKSFRLINKDLYGYRKGSGTESTINSQFPYCYILQNVDFTEATTQYCQIRFQRAYRADLHFATTDEYEYERIKFSDEIYNQGFGNYFTLADEKVYSKEENPSDGSAGTTQQVIKLKNEEMRGVYDIILVFRSAREGTTGNTDRAYNIGLYAYRHTNIFLKVFDGNPTGTITYYQGNDGATTTPPEGAGANDGYEFVKHDTGWLFSKSYPIGVSVKSTDTDDGGRGTIAQCVNAAVKDKNPENVKLYDHVTGAEVAHYEPKEGVTDNAEGVYLEYGGKYYELVFNPFKIRKNYIFYIAKN